MASDFSDRIEAWALQQPEVIALWSADRAERKRVGRLIANIIVTLPERQAKGGNRANRRAMEKTLRKFLGEQTFD